MTRFQTYSLRIVLACIGMLFIGTGCALLVFTGLGSDPFNVMAQGLSGRLGLPVGTVSSLQHAVLLIVLLFIDRKHIGLGSVLGVVIVGGIMNLWAIPLDPWLAAAALPIRITTLLLAPVSLGIGVSMVQLSRLGMAPNDITPLVISERTTRFSFRMVRIGYDFVLFAAGVLLGGVYGIGTIVAVLSIGPCIQFALGVLRRSPIGALEGSAGK